MALLAPPIYSEKYLDVLSLNNQSTHKLHFYKTLLKTAEDAIVKDFYDGTEVIQLVKSRAWVVEQIILQIWNEHIKSKSLALIAVGGFGRGGLHPFSDVDLLVLRPKNNHKFDEKISLFIQSLWDIGLDVGQSVRTPEDCQIQAEKDVTIATNLMEARFIRGNKKLFTRMEKKLLQKKYGKVKIFTWQKSKSKNKDIKNTATQPLMLSLISKKAKEDYAIFK